MSVPKAAFKVKALTVWVVKDGQTGYTFELGSVNDLRSKINLLIENPNEAIKMGQAARKYVEKELCSERHYGQLMEIYEMARSSKL